MNMRAAFHETLKLAEERKMDEMPGTEFGLEHLRSMHVRIAEDRFSEAKPGRWLGWAQCMVAVAGCASLEEMKTINLKHSM